ncbi:MAG: epoxyqueuosine reductase QueH [Tannerella sp.]|jgi:predicted adenine nucleotide alpha hydrolase (AANH) superfamily ATPase|nr:epoxyqueuosine reductase QueH [Tannerella sp.]
MTKKKSELEIEAPGGATEILLHVCCAPCSSAIVECLLEHGIRPTMFYYNPNIFPDKEYEKRKAECLRHTQALNLDFVDADYDHDKWLGKVKGLEREPERGARCLKCFKERLAAAALYADTHNFRVFATTLATSRWKSPEQIVEAGTYAASFFPELTFWTKNWRKGGLSERRNELVRLYGFYNQTYCGCEFSMNSKKGTY